MEHSTETLNPEDSVRELDQLIKQMKKNYSRTGGEFLNGMSTDEIFENSLFAVVDHAEQLASKDIAMLQGAYERKLCDFVRYISKTIPAHGFRHEKVKVEERLSNLAQNCGLTELKSMTHALLDTSYFTIGGKVERLISKIPGMSKKKRVE